MAQYNQLHEESESLVYRPLKADEWNETYLLDIAQDHGVKRPSWNDVNRIRPRTKTIERAALRDPRHVSMVNSGYPQYAGLPAPAWASASRLCPLRYCPHCLIEDSYFRARWRLNGYLICSRHRCFIKRDIQLFHIPGGRFQKSKKSFGPLIEDELLEGAKYCTPDELEIHQAVWGNFEQRLRGESPSAEEIETTATQAAWSILTWSLIDRVARINCTRLSRQTFVGPVAGIASFFQSNNLEVSASHVGVLAFFRHLTEYQTYAGGIRHLQRIDRFEKQGPSLVSIAKLEVLLQAVQAARPEIGTKRTVGDKCFVRNDQRGMSVYRFSKILGISDVTAGKWARCGLIRTESRSNVQNSRLCFVPPDEVKAFRHLRRSLLTREEFCVQHALDEDAGHTLYHAGVFHTIDFARCRYITKESVSNLMLRLELQCAPLDELHPRLKWPLFGTEVKTVAYQNSERISLLNAAAAGEVRLFRSLSSPGLSSFFVGVDALAWLHRRVKHLRTKHVRSAAMNVADCDRLFHDH